MNKDASVNKKGSGIRSMTCRRGFRDNTIIAPGLLAIVLLTLVVLSSGCGRKSGENVDQYLTGYIGIVNYVKGIDAPEGNPGTPANTLLHYVLPEEKAYYSGLSGEYIKAAGVYAGDDVRDTITAVKNRFISAISAGYDMTAGEFEEYRDTVIDGLYLTYLSDNAKHAKYDAEHDTYDSDAFSLSAYGVEAEQYVNICYEETVIDRYIDAEAKKIESNIDPDRVYNYYRDNISDFDFAEADILITARAPADVGSALEQASALAGVINASDDPVAAYAEEKEKAEGSQELQDWTEESGFVLIKMNVQYAGLPGEIQKKLADGGTGALAMEYEGNVYLVYLEHEKEYSKADFISSGIYDTVRELASRKQAESLVSILDLDIIWIISAEEAEAMGLKNIDIRSYTKR